MSEAAWHSNPILILTALRWEATPLLHLLEKVKKEKVGGKLLWRGWTGKQEIIVAPTGVGQERAGKVTRQIGQGRKISCLISTGCAGALVPELCTGDVIIAQDIVAVSGGRSLAPYHPSAEWLKRARALPMRNNFSVRIGRIASSAKPVLRPEEKRDLQEKTRALAVEMEGAALADFAERSGLPFLVVRAILDTADMTLPFGEGMLTSRGEVDTLQAIAHLLRHPRLWRDVWHLRQMTIQVQQSLLCFFRAFLLSFHTSIGPH